MSNKLFSGKIEKKTKCVYSEYSGETLYTANTTSVVNRSICSGSFCVTDDKAKRVKTRQGIPLRRPDKIRWVSPSFKTYFTLWPVLYILTTFLIEGSVLIRRSHAVAILPANGSATFKWTLATVLCRSSHTRLHQTAHIPKQKHETRVSRQLIKML